jgi:hypothetical protein
MSGPFHCGTSQTFLPHLFRFMLLFKLNSSVPSLVFRLTMARSSTIMTYVLAAHGMVLRLTCPYTSQQNGRADHVLRTLNDSLRTMLLHVDALLSFWPDTLATVTYLLNHRPCRTHNDLTSYQLLLGVPPDYSHLHVFGCRCYPNTTTTTPHKLATC